MHRRIISRRRGAARSSDRHAADGDGEHPPNSAEFQPTGPRRTSLSEQDGDESACKPDSVARRPVIIHLRPPLPAAFARRRATYPDASRGQRSNGVRGPASEDTKPFLVLLRLGFAEPPRSPGMLVVSYTAVSPLPPSPAAVCSLWHFPAGHPGWALPTTLSFGVRTFLDAVAPRSPGRLVQLVILRQESLGSAWHVLPLEQVSRDKPTQLHGGLFHELP